VKWHICRRQENKDGRHSFDVHGRSFAGEAILDEQCYYFDYISQGVVLMPEAIIKNLEITPKPKCMRCGSDHSVSDVGHWLPGWWTCQICNIRWEEDEYED
jgi:hypothetical protein